jgi:transposase-like protein
LSENGEGLGGKRRKWSGAGKLRIALAGMAPNVDVADLCRCGGHQPTQYFGRKKKLQSSASKNFDDAGSRPSAHEERQAEELCRRKHVVAEITAGNSGPRKEAVGFEEQGQLRPVM